MRGLRVISWMCAYLLVSAGCGDSSTGSGTGGLPSNPDATGFADTGPGDTGPNNVTPPQGGEKLDFTVVNGDDGKACKGTDRCALFMSFNSTRQLDVVATRNGAPVNQLQVTWEITKNKNNSLKISTKSSFSGSDGKTTITAQQVAQQEAQYEVKAYVEGSDATPIFFDIVVTPKGQVPLIVSYTYEGARQFQAVTTFLFKHESPQKAIKCETIDPGNLPTADLSSPPKGLNQSAAFPSLPGLQDEGTQIYTVVGIGKDTNGPPLVWGCDDSAAVVTYIGSKNVVVPLGDLPPKWKGKYEVTTKFDLVSILPDDVEQVVDTILGFFTDPGGQLLVTICQLAGSVNFIDDLCGFAFKDPANPCLEDECFDTGGLAAKSIIESLLNDLLEDNVGGDILFTGSDIAKILTELELTATIEFKEEPSSADGTFTEEITEETWHSVTYRWTLGTDCAPEDQNCGKHTFSVAAFQGGTASGSFSGKVDYQGNEQFLHIDEHPLNIKYGALLNFIIKNEILPRIAGDGSEGVKVDTYEEFVKSLLGGYDCLSWEIDPSVNVTCCEQFAADLTNSTTGLVGDIAKAACEAGVPVLSEQLEKLLIDLDVDSGGDGEGFTLQTSTGGCQCFDHDANQTIDTWGALDTPCHWDTQLGVGDSIENDFWGAEQQ
ncbi:MAG: hypothetical protein ACI9WU_001069 [Myxococcota bacterium]|jgi:hypothetical protein